MKNDLGIYGKRKEILFNAMEKTLAKGGIVQDSAGISIAPEGSEFIVPLSAMEKMNIISLKQPDTPILEAGDGYEIILPESYKNIPQSVEDFGDIQEVHFGKMPLSEVFAKQPAKKQIRQIEKAKAKTKRRKANKAAKKSRKK